MNQFYQTSKEHIEKYKQLRSTAKKQENSAINLLLNFTTNSGKLQPLTVQNFEFLVHRELMYNSEICCQILSQIAFLLCRNLQLTGANSGIKLCRNSGLKWHNYSSKNIKDSTVFFHSAIQKYGAMPIPTEYFITRGLKTAANSAELRRFSAANQFLN